MIRVLHLLFVFVPIVTFSAWAKEKVDIAIIETLPVAIVTESRIAFEAELQRLMPDKDIHFRVYNAEGSVEQANALLSDMLAESTPDLVVSLATLATRAVLNKDELLSIPKLFMVVSEPVTEGIVPAFGATSKRNITGESHVVNATVKLDMLDGVFQASEPVTALKIGLIHTSYPSSFNAASALIAIQSAYQNIQFIPIKTPYIAKEAGLETMKEDIISLLKSEETALDGYWLSAGPLIETPNLIADIKKQTGLLPLFAESVSAVKEGALIGIVSQAQDIGVSAAKQAERILALGSSETIPVEQIENFTVAVNVTTAIKLQLPIPSNYLRLSEQHVYQ
ncbi:ABC transporter substrate binding protein [Alteromonas sp.]|uniref:ABC transporter substrate-binding protein n=1 Tax=Alteromonas sp. TaxID=232 RepID=UPI000B721E72|nr:ABC transporter substrate binding protein [Alteromonas sp.]MAI38775.1 ABC transporter substrate-binding protein [Alteromonas sp.]OUX85297.1 MAG: ABC transporter substrate-binding protein [Alteromonas sp. TMED35]|tara:strand:- start:44574 stop:45587 length:1014 start_codon:yes stop_codon:yes gene_type:complete